jgi:hypothetical protein
MYNLSDLVWLTYLSVLFYIGLGVVVGIIWLAQQNQTVRRWGNMPHPKGYIHSKKRERFASAF